MSHPVGRVVCEPYPFSNDYWDKATVQQLGCRLNSQNTPKENAAAVVIGSGGLPYMLSRLNVARVVIADLEEEVIENTVWRVASLANHDNWVSYNNAISDELGAVDELRFSKELSKARSSGLQGDYSLARKAAATTVIHGLHGDIRLTAPKLGSQLRMAGEAITFMNVTNAARYLGTGSEATYVGRQALREAMDTMPMSDEAIVADSSNGLEMRLYPIADYPPVDVERPPRLRLLPSRWR